MGRYLLLISSTLLALTLRGVSAQTEPASGCVQPATQAHASNFTTIFDDPAVQNKSIQLLAQAVQFPTMSFDGMGVPGVDPRWAPFDDFHAFLEASFPNLYSKANVTAINTYSLVFTLNGSNPDLMPMMITGHQDVVPATTSLDRWTFPPFSGTVDDTWIYGRGSGDCKNTVIGSMIAVEHLLEQGWTPTRTLLLAFGQDEEIGGHMGATNVNLHLLSLYGEDGVAMIVDEGGSGVDSSQFGRTFALPGVVEKGSVNIMVEVDMMGGHSSIPTDKTSIGVLSEIAETFENSHVFQPHLEEAHPVWSYLQCATQFGDPAQIPAWISQDVNVTSNPNLQDAANNFANISISNRYLIQTSKAATIFNAGVKSNELPESANGTFNVRIEIFSNVTAVQDAFLTFVHPVAEKYSLTVNGTSFSDQPSIGNITVIWGNPHDPTPKSPFDANSTAWRVISELNQAIWGDVITAPSAMTGNTDTRNYLSLTKNIYRWSPIRVGERVGMHTVDERISIRAYLEGLKFYTELIVRVDNVTTDDGL
ncbi:hypothetical protein D9756_003636 [Leucocoprinus leucothites]|uniref:Peptidase M20 dimerisation domain-containing protein n=1 Tax=Leucocoprinus leucothites TaxID=201217 RepID=A0A8H5LJH5_9AGAR|nr:hypothetical protein D9756_003636 [Leucoagaricus leucothites]